MTKIIRSTPTYRMCPQSLFLDFYRIPLYDNRRSSKTVLAEINEFLKTSNLEFNTLLICIWPEVPITNLFSNVFRYGHHIMNMVEINYIAHLDRKMLCKIIVAFAHCKKITLNNLGDIDLAGDCAIGDNWRIDCKELFLGTGLDRDIFLKQVHKVFYSVEKS